MPPAISVESLSKLYRVHHAARGGYRTLREDLTSLATAPWHKAKKLFGENGSTSNGESDEAFWALKDVSFAVEPGEVIGIIGRNGAGKSTLLKILSRITPPTSGRVTLNGRVGSLLEVGTGFHPELTGRENVFMNGSILGMSRKEIQKRFDAIVDFSGVEKFLDTPVKRYSSGMQVRLAFAVAAHLEPEILIIDEVLAVGDAEFQKKCLGRMNEVAKDGRTVLFVSHNLAAVSELCNSGIVLSSGEIAVHAPAADAIATYVRAAAQRAPTVVLSSARGTTATGQSVLGIVEVTNSDGMPTSSVLMGDPILLRIAIESSTRLSRPTVGIGFDDMYGRRILSVNSDECHQTLPDLGYSAVVTCEVPAPPLTPGQYSVKLVVRNCQIDCLAVENAAIVTVVSSNVLGTATGPRTGVCFAKSQWSVN